MIMKTKKECGCGHPSCGERHMIPPMEHTPTPWFSTKDGYILNSANRRQADCVGKTSKAEDAAFIVRAVNLHERYERIINALKPWVATGKMPTFSTLMPDTDETFGQAIAKAEEK